MLSPSGKKRRDELLAELLPPIERRRDEVQRKLDELAYRRTAMPPRERAAAREVAVVLRDELARLDLLAAVTTRLLQPAAHIRPVRPWQGHGTLEGRPEPHFLHPV